MKKNKILLLVLFFALICASCLLRQGNSKTSLPPNVEDPWDLAVDTKCGTGVEGVAECVQQGHRRFVVLIKDPLDKVCANEFIAYSMHLVPKEYFVETGGFSIDVDYALVPEEMPELDHIKLGENNNLYASFPYESLEFQCLKPAPTPLPSLSF